MIRPIVRILIIVTGTIIGIGALAIIGFEFTGEFFLVHVFSARMTVTGRVTDGSGKPIKGAEVSAIPLDVSYPLVGDMGDPKAGERKTVSDKSGRYRFDGLVASSGMKEGVWVQEWAIVANAVGYAPQKTRVRKDFNSPDAINTLTDFVLEKEGTASGTKVTMGKGPSSERRSERLLPPE